MSLPKTRCERLFFFFSSRRRHTRCSRDWSSDVCSSDLVLIYADGYWRNGKWVDHKAAAEIAVKTAEKEGQHIGKVLVWKRYSGKYSSEKIGRASCRERV